MPRNVLFVNTPAYLGGAEISLLTTMAHLDAQHYHPALLTGGRGQLLERATEEGITASVQEFPWLSRRRPWPYLGSILRLVRSIKKNRIDLVHSNCDHSLRYVQQACFVSRIPYVCHVRDDVRAWFQPANLRVLNKSKRVIAPSKAMQETCIRAGVRPNLVEVVFNPIDVEQFSSTSNHSERLYREFQIPPESLVVAIAGQIQPIKGHLEFVEAGIRLAASRPDVFFLIVGPVPDGQETFFVELKARIKDAGFADRFLCTGFRNDIADVMGIIDVLAVPSWTEAFGRVAVEGQAAGCAVIGTRVGGLPEIISDGHDGMLITPRDASSLFSTLMTVAENDLLRRRLGQNGKLSARRFAPEIHIRQIQRLYDDVLPEERQCPTPSGPYGVPECQTDVPRANSRKIRKRLW